MRIANPKDVEYLALEGGGGKGITFLGAIRALEKLEILPIDINKPGQNQIKGISGASAGAITALMLAMGLGPTELEKILSKPQTFIEFFDGPDADTYRMVNRQNKPVIKSDVPPNMKATDFRKARIKQLKSTINLASVIAAFLACGPIGAGIAEISSWSILVEVLRGLAKSGIFGQIENPIALQIIKHPELYLYNLVFDRGLFPGFAPRKFLSHAISLYLAEKIHQRSSGGEPNGANLNFQLFHKMTGVDLVITGANITKHKPAVFSSRHTPNFPVAEAVGISMNLPVLFKPVYVEADVPVVCAPNNNTDDYHGFWIDGGLLNNLPLHAFDYLQPPLSPHYPSFRPLHPKILGLRLTEGPDRPRPKSDTFSVLREHMGNLMDTILFPAEQGQIRTADEADQTIDLYTYELETTEFAPPQAKWKTPVDKAETAVYSYFGLKK